MRARTSSWISAGAFDGEPASIGGCGSYSMPSWMAWATSTPASSMASVNAMSMPADTPAPVRFLPKWDNTLLGHADRRRVISDELRRVVIGKNGDVAPTVLVDGVVAATWNGSVEVTYLGPVTRTQKADVAAEAERLKAWLP